MTPRSFHLECELIYWWILEMQHDIVTAKTWTSHLCINWPKRLVWDGREIWHKRISKHIWPASEVVIRKEARNLHSARRNPLKNHNSAFKRTAEGTYICDYSLPHNENHIIGSSKGNAIIRQPDVVREKTLTSFALFQTLKSVISLYIRSMTPDFESCGTCRWCKYFRIIWISASWFKNFWYTCGISVTYKDWKDCDWPLLKVIILFSSSFTVKSWLRLKPFIIYVNILSETGPKACPP